MPPQGLKSFVYRALVCLALAAPIGLLVSLYDEALLSNDACQYISVARNLSSGKGLSTSIAYYEEHYRLGGLPVAQTVFPPGYPVLIAAFIGIGVPGARSALLVNLVCFALSIFAVYELARTRGHARSRAGLLAAIWALSVAGWICVLGCTAEMPFILATLASLKWLGEGGKGERPLLAGLAAAAAVTFRYAGVFLLAALALVLGIELAREWGKARLRRFASVVGPPLVVTAALFLRNQVLVGDFKGGNDQLGNQSLPEVAREMYRALSGLLGFSVSGLVGHRLPEVLLVACLVSLAAVWIATRGPSIDRAGASWRRDRVVVVSVSYIGLTLASIAYLELTKPVGLGARMLLPLWPLVLLLALEVAPRRRGRSPAPVLLRRLTLGLVAAAFVAGQAALLEEHLSEEGVTRCRSLRASFAGSELPARLAEEARAGRPVLANQPQQVGEILRQPVLGLTERPYTSRVWTPDAVRALAAAYGVRYVVFHPASLADSGNQLFFRELASGRVPPWLVAEASEADLRLYRIAAAPEAEPSGAPRQAPPSAPVN